MMNLTRVFAVYIEERRRAIMDDECEKWLARAREGDQAAFGLLVKQLYPRLFRVVFGLIRNEADAQEVCQQTWVKVWSSLHTFKGDAAFTTWLFRIATNTSWDFLRQKKRRASVEFVDVHDNESPDSETIVSPPSQRPDKALDHRELKRHFQNALEHLSEKHRTALVLREIEGLSYREIAKIMGSNMGTVMSRIFTARKSIQSKMKDLQ